ncbi:MAG: type I 3-dehydroquinate dehydratase [Phycisphaeraceae bacterium]|nr:type I 3-dehydroquinate dehydratase [Phycisphaeraceae bacterium]
MSLICTPIPVPSPDAALRDAHAAKAAGADLVEFRLDDFFTGDDAQVPAIVALISDCPLPCIATCRLAAEGGHYDGPDDARISLFERLGTAFGKEEHPPRYIDIEAATYDRSANIRQKINLAIDHPEQIRDLQTSLILSMHDFQGRPADLTRRVLAMSRHAAAKILKVAFLARSIRDNLELFDLLAHRDRPMIALAMGEHGLMSRILAPKFGGFLTFASLHPSAATAPGQPTIADLLNLYRFRSIKPTTSVYGVVGSPVSHSLSPRLHNAGFDAVNHDGVYLPLPIAPGYESLKATLLELIHHPTLSLRGLSITLPHKENIVRLAREQRWSLDAASDAINAANTVSIERTSTGEPARIEVANTDSPALARSIAEAVGEIRGKRIALLGAGGVAKAAAHALRSAELTILNRTRSRAQSLADSIPGARAATLSEFQPVSPVPFDLIINGTPLGMRDGPAPDASPLSPELLRALPSQTIVMDTIYTLLETPFLRAAREAGLRTLSGVSMFVDQAAAQFTRWTGAPAPTRLFERLVREHAG